jgi:diguanylate cyclase (GGDEF)-like protein
MALLFLDLDRFKYVNDSLGHQAGDALLVEVALRITSRVRGSDTVCRLGGDEFTLILDEITRSEDAGLVSQSILEELSKPFLIQGKELFVGASIGIAIFPYDDTTAEGLFRKADAAMYKAKEAGRNTYRFVSGETDALNKSRLDLEVELRRGFERGEFILHYQPLVRISDQRVIGAEALIRWERPGEPEPVLPGRFIELAEENGLIINLGEWVLLEACRRAAEWRERGLPLSVSVNISGRHFEHGGLGAQVAAALEASGLPPELLTIELTETTVMANVTTALRAMVELKAIGVSLAIDDFGTGYSSLSYLGRFPIDRLKIDQSFVGSLGSAPNVSAIVSAVISMARSLGLETVAEGIETAEQLAYLTERGCGIAQGYLFSRALTSEAFFSYATAPVRGRG